MQIICTQSGIALKERSVDQCPDSGPGDKCEGDNTAIPVMSVCFISLSFLSHHHSPDRTSKHFNRCVPSQLIKIQNMTEPDDPLSRKLLLMIDQFCIFTTTGLILWSKTFCELSGKPVNKMIKEMILAERSNEKKFIEGPYMLQWTLNNDLGLVFVVVYQRILQLMYIDDLLASVKRSFTATFEDRFPLTKMSFFPLPLTLVPNSISMISLRRFSTLRNRFPTEQRSQLSYVFHHSCDP